MTNTLSRSWIGALLLLASATTACADAEEREVSTSREALTVPAPLLRDYAMLARHGASFGDRTQVNGGDLGVAPSGTSVLNVLTGNIDVRLGVGQVLLSQRMVLRDRAVTGELGVTQLELGAGVVTGPRSAFLAPPAIPGPGTFTAGTAPVTVNVGQTLALAAGRYGAVNVSGILNLSGGLYEVQIVRLNPDARIVALANSVLRVTGGVSGGDRTRLVTTTGLAASGLRVMVAGVVDTANNSVVFGTDAQLTGLFVSSGHFRAADRLVMNGAVAGQDVVIGNDGVVAYSTGFECSSNAGCNDNNPCTTDACTDARCVFTPVSNGTACTDGNACTQTDTCQAGVCTGNNPVVCTPSDQCHSAGTCNPTSGICSNPALANGTACNDGNACTQTSSCQAGVCSGANPVVCTASDQCHDAGTCDPGTGMCSNPPKPNGSACSDANGCTQTDTCQSGLCTGANPVVCATPDQCHDPGTCDPGTGTCSNPAKPDGTACNDENNCTKRDTCVAGVCDPGDPVVCEASDQCHDAGTCDPSTGTCSNPERPDGTACDDGTLCTQTDACQAGACVGGEGVVCTASDECHDVGTCDPESGLCSNPPVPDGTPCDDEDACTLGDVCSAGICAAGADYAITEFESEVTSPSSIVSGPFGDLWYAGRETSTEAFDGSLAHITTGGVVTEIAAFARDPQRILPGPDGYLWVAEQFLGGLPALGRFDAASGAFVTDYFPGINTFDMAASNDGGTPVMWLTAGFSVVRMNPAGTILSTTPTRNVARAIAASAPNPNTTIWITEASASGNAVIGRLDFPTLAQFSIATPGELFDLVEGPDGNIWFTDAGTNDIGRLTPDGATLTKFPVPTAASTPHGIAVGPDDALWFTEQSGNKIGRITTSGVIQELCIPTSGSGPTSIATGSDGNVWFTETAAGKIGRVELPTSLALADRSDPGPIGEPAESASAEQGCSVARGPSRQSGTVLALLFALGLGLGARRRRVAYGSGSGR